MTKLINEKLKGVYKLLSERHLTIISDVNDDLKCGICKSVLNDAHLTSCGCNFCKTCIDNYRQTGGHCCPGITDECREIDLSNIVVNNGVNRQISRLRVKCDEENCDFQCELIKMSVHLVRCSKKKLNCPFNIVGCEEKLIADQINNHLQIESLSHNKLLMEVINNLKNEVSELKNIEKRNKSDIMRLTKQVEKNDDDIIMLKENNFQIKRNDENKIKEFENKFIGEQMKAYQCIIETVTANENNYRKEIEDLKLSFKNMEEPGSLRSDINCLQMQMQIKYAEEKMEAMNSNSNKIKDETIELINEKATLIKMDIENIKTEISKRMDSILVDHERMMSELDKFKEVTVQESNSSCLLKVENELIKVEIEKLMAAYKEFSQNGNSEIKEKLNRLEKYLDRRLGVFKWNIGVLSKLEKDRYLFGEYFYDRNNLYKMGLRICLFGYKLLIRLLIYKEENDAYLEWPFKATVTIKISDKMNPDKAKSIANICVISQPIKDIYNDSGIFTFNSADLQNAELLDNCDCLIECFIDYNI